MSAFSYIVVRVLFHVCLLVNTPLKVAGTSSSSEEFIVTQNENAFIYKSCPFEENIIKNILHEKKLSELELEALKQDLNDKDSNMKRKLDKLEDATHDVKNGAENKLNKFEKDIMERLRDYFDETFDAIISKTEKQSQNISYDLKEISVTQDNLLKNIDLGKIRMLDMENKSIEHERTLGTLKIISADFEQKLDSLKIAKVESGDALNDTVSDAFNRLFIMTNEANNSSQNIEKSRTHSLVTPIINTTVEPIRSDSYEFREINWGDCKQEEVKDTYYTMYDYSSPLKPFASKGLRHVLLRTTGGRTEFLSMQFGLQASYRGDIMLSPEQNPMGTGFYFLIIIHESNVYLMTTEAGQSKLLADVYTTNLMSSQPAAILLTVTNDTLKLRHAAGSPFLEQRHHRLADVKYFGFGGWGNADGQGTFYYDC